MKKMFRDSSITAFSDWLISEGLLEPNADDKTHPEREGVQQVLEGFTQTVREGYHLVLDEVGAHRQAEFKISAKAVKQMHSPKKAAQACSENAAMQHILGISSNAMAEMHEIGRSFIHQKNYENAVRVFAYLVYLNPYVAWFWQGLGHCWQTTGEAPYAAYAYAVAINCEPFSLELYRDAVNCLLEIKEYDNADKLLQYGINLIQHSRDKVLNHELQKQLEAIQRYVNSLK